MTFRLVGLMSVVLLVSLAALALLMSHYQDRVMGELARTVSEVGRATLQTLDAVPNPGTLRTQGGDGSAPGSEHPAVVDLEPPSEGAIVLLAHVDTRAPGEAVVTVQRHGEPMRRMSLEEARAQGLIPEQAAVDVLKAAPAEGGPGQVQVIDRQVTMIKLDDVRTEAEAERLFLHIPTQRAEGQDANGYRFAWTTGTGAGPTDGGQDPVLFNEELRFEVPTEDYRDLFSKLRSRSGFVFLGVFVLGTALSAGLATRFTRPVRQLDAALHRLSEGDLDVRVPVRGRDEMARLGKAFNEMAARLRAGREQAREMTRREKLSSLGRLAAGVAHDVRNPLHSIGLTLQHLQEACGPESDDRRRDFDRSLAIIREEIHRLDKLVANFLTFARGDRREREPVGLPELVRETARLVEKEAERRGVRVEIVAEPVPAVPADVESVRASILNLVLNSFEAMPEGGVLRMRVFATGGEVTLEVADTGRGIPETDRERVFEFAYTTRDGGHGLGLAMVHQVVVEEHGGRVSLDSRPGEGTRVSLVFPVGDASRASS
jgi:signal transduction histidine kinase